MLPKSENEPEKDLPSDGQDTRKTTVGPQTFLRLLKCLKPSIFNSRRSARPARLRPTAYLDGIRGFAALLVYIMHHLLWAHEGQQGDRRFQSSFGSQREYFFATFPIVRTFFTGGHLAVAVFFILSGYVLSNKPLALIHAGEYAALGNNLASAIFRRWFRLYLPIFAITFLVIAVTHLLGVWADYYPESTFGAELWKWYLQMKNYSFVFDKHDPPWFYCHRHIWTIPIELLGSLLVYATHLALSRSTRNARLLSQVAMIWYFMYIVDGSFFSMFLTGALLCDLDQLASADQLPAWLTRLQKYSTPIFYSSFVIGLLLGGVPSYTNDMDYFRDSPGWYYLSFFIPQAVFGFRWFYLYWGAFLTVVSIPRIPWIKGFFESRFCQYLGRISYMLYLVHGPVLWTFGDRVYAATGWSRENHNMVLPAYWTDILPLPKWGPLGLEVGFVLPHLVLLPVTLWLSEIATTLIDTPAINFGSWLYKKTLGPVEQE